MDLWFEWREDNNEERFSFEDSDRFEEDSLVSWNSEPESICANWRGWKQCSQSQSSGHSLASEKDDEVHSLIELCAKTVANSIPFEAVEYCYPQIPEQLQLRIAFWSFPRVEDDIRLYCCLANGSPDEYQKGEHLVKAKAVRDALQIGFHLSATVNQQHSSVQTKGTFSVAVTFDRGHITSCNCTCCPSATWCAHIIALCLFRIHHPDQVCLRAPVSEYLSRLRRDQLQKFAQYLISELPQQILPTAQRILDELLSSQESAINTMSGAPDPTAGPATTDHNKWCMDEKGLRENVRKMLIRFCGPGPLVFSDVSAMYMSNTAPPTAAEWSNLLRPLKGREPEGMWNLLYIVRELFHRRDSNAISLLYALTEECLANDQVVIWWFDSRSQASGSSVHRNHGNGYRNNTNAASTEATKHACAGFCDELVVLWRLAALNPKLSDDNRQDLKVWLEHWHQDAVDKARSGHGAGFQAAVACFPGFHPAIDACFLSWGNTEISSDTEKPQDEFMASDSFCQGDDNAIGVRPACASSRTSEARQDQAQEAHEEDAPTPVKVHDTEEDLEELCARAEALHVHGYSSKASKLAVRLAERILDSRTHLNQNANAKTPKSNKQSSFSSTTLVKAAFLCGVLAEDPHCHYLAFKVGMLGLEMPRQPAKSKALEVKLAHQESELTALLRKLPLRGEEMMVVREKAHLICQGKLQRGGAVLPIMLATFIFEVLCCQDKFKKESKNCQEKKVDEDLGYMAAFCTLGMRPNILESQYPILCEGIRRQRGDLAIALLDHCKDTPSRLKAVKEVLLDKTRYDGPGFVGEVERPNDAKQSNAKLHENENKTHNTAVRNRGGFGLASCRHGSNSQSSSYTSDSGTDSGSRSSSGGNRPRGRPAGGKMQSKLTVTVCEVSREEESGSSSGVDTDSAVNHPSPNVSAKVVGVCHMPPRGAKNNVQGMLGTRKDRKTKALTNSKRQDRATSDLEGSDIDDVGNNDDVGIDSGGVALSPTDNITIKVREITVPFQNRELEDRRDSSSSGEKDTGRSLPESPVNISPTVSSSSAVGSSEGSSGGDPALSSREGKAKAPLKTFMTVGLPDPPKNLSRETSNTSTVSNQNPLKRDIMIDNAIEQDQLQNQLSSCGPNSERDNQVSMSCNSELESVDEALELDDEKFESSENSKTESRDGLAMASCPSNANDNATALSQDSEGPSGWHKPEAKEDTAGWIESAAVKVESVSEGIAVAEGTEPSSGRNRRYPNKRNRRKKKGKNSAVNQATEAEAHFMFELAKTVLTRAGGNCTTSVFSTQTTSASHSGPHRGLQLCAFELGLFALGLHNRTSINWLSRTYSSHVSWISGQAMEIGSAAIQLLIERWESNLTPSEVASIADRASRSNDSLMVRAAAELGLSCLHMAHTLNPGEIQRALLQCRDEDVQLLDRACQAVESAARGGGVYPEVLFDVARHWHYLHEQSQANNTRSHKENSRRSSQSSRTQPQCGTSSSTPSAAPCLHGSLGSHQGFNSIPPPPYQTPEQYVQTQMHQQVQHLMNQGSYTSPYRPSNQSNYGYNSRQLHSNQFQISGSYGGLPPPYQSGNPAVCQLSSRALSTQPAGQVSYYLNNAYRVGMLALESLARRTPDDRPTVKYSRNPPCSDDIRWLCSLSGRLGTSYLHRFCVSALNAVVSPFVLHDLALEAARHLARSNPAQLAVNLRSPNISPLVQKSLSMYAQCIQHHLVTISQSDHEEFVELLRHARGAFCMVPGGMSQFNELLQSIRRLYPKKKDLWQKIMTGLAKA